ASGRSRDAQERPELIRASLALLEADVSLFPPNWHCAQTPNSATSCRCSMGEQPRNGPLPPKRKWWVEHMPRAGRRSYLMREELGRPAVSRGGDETTASREFLTRWRKASGNGKPGQFEPWVRQAGRK